MKKTKIFLLLIAMLSAITLTACGGGSGGGGGDGGGGSNERAWEPATVIGETNSSQNNAFETRVVVDNSGNIFVVWLQLDLNAVANVWANRYDTSAKTWGTAELLETTSGSAFFLNLAVDDNGNAIAVWQHENTNNSTYRIMANRYSAANRWWSGSTLVETGTGSAIKPRVAMDAEGNAMVVWQQANGLYYNIWANRFSVLGGWGTPQIIETGSSDDVNPDIGYDRHGNFIAVWLTSNGIRYYVVNQFYNIADSRWNGTSLVETVGQSGSFVSGPMISTDRLGNIMVIWENSSGLWANRYTRGQGWGSSPAHVQTGTNDIVEYSIDSDTNGNAMVVWVESDGASDSAMASRYDTTDGWGAPIQLETGIGKTDTPRVAFDQTGNAMAVWIQNDGTRSDVWFNQHTGGRWGIARLVENDNEYSAYFPAVAYDLSDTAIVAWVQRDSMVAYERVRISRFR